MSKYNEICNLYKKIMIDRISWCTCLGELNAGPKELQIYVTNMEDGFDHIVMYYYNEDTLEMDK